MHTCAFCGFENVSGTLFCEGCGSGLTAEAQGHRYATGAVLSAEGATNAAARPAGSRFTTGDVSEEDAPTVSPIAHEPELDAPAPAAVSAPMVGDWAATANPEHAAIIGTDSTWSAEPTPAPSFGSGEDVATQPQHDVEPPAAAPQPAATVAAVYLMTESGRRVDVPTQEVVIVGREDMRSGIRPDVDLTLDGASAAGVSRRHCRLLYQGDGWYVEDLMSTNFTVLNGKPLAPHTPVLVRHGDELRLGKLRLRFHQS